MDDGRKINVMINELMLMDESEVARKAIRELP